MLSFEGLLVWLHDRYMTGLLLFAVAFLAASQVYPGRAFADDFFDHDNTILHIRGYYSSSGIPVFAPLGSYANNKVLLAGSNDRAFITGGYAARHRQSSGGPGAHPLELRGNRLTMLGGYIEGAVHGAFGEGGALAVGNSLLVDDAYAFIQGVTIPDFALAATGAVGVEARQNSVLLYSGTVRGSISGGHGESLASGNKVLLHGGTVSGSVYGGSTHSGNCSGNMLFMTGGTVREWLIGGYSSYNGLASGNTVFFSGGIVGGISGSLAFEQQAAGNTVIISGGRIAPDEKESGRDASFAFVCGGYSVRSGATDNQIFLSGKADLEACIFWGGAAEAASGSGKPQAADLISGNMLVLEEDYEGGFPRARNFEHVFVTGGGARLPESGYSFASSVLRLNNYGTMRFSGRSPSILEFRNTEYAAVEGSINVYFHPLEKRMDRVVLHEGALLMTALHIRLENPEDLPLDTPVPVAEIEHASSMRYVNRRFAVVARQAGAASGGMEQEYVLVLKPLLEGEDKDIWLLEKKRKTRQK